MTETTSRASLNFYHGVDGPTLMFLFYEGADLTRLKTIFLGLAQGEASEVSLRAAGIVEFASAIDDLVIVQILDEHEPSRTVRKVKDTLRGPLFEFCGYKEGWLECAELLDGLKAPGHQYLSRGSMDEALVMVSYRENLQRIMTGTTGQRSEHKTNNNVCFLFAMMVVWASLFSTGAPCAVLRAMF